MNKSVRPRETEIAKSPPDKQRVDMAAKLGATYWLGLLSFDDAKYDVAANWFGKSELSAASSPWIAGARYNLARSYEAEHKPDVAVPLLQSAHSPQQQGDRIRAAQLVSQTTDNKSEPSPK
jgi:TolA-binding protein